MGDVEACDRLAEPRRIGNDLMRIGHGILRVNDDQSVCCFDDVAIDAPAIVGGGIGVYAKLAAAGQGDFSKHDQPPSRNFPFWRCAAICLGRPPTTTESDVKGCKSEAFCLREKFTGAAVSLYASLSPLPTSAMSRSGCT